MNISSKIKSFLTAIAGTPVVVTENCIPIRTTKIISQGSLSQQDSGNNVKPKNEKIKRLNTTKKDWEIKSRYIWRYIRLLIKFTVRVFFSAIFFVVLAHFVPELREQAPSFYRFVDFFIECLEWLCAQFWIVAEKVF